MGSDVLQVSAAALELLRDGVDIAPAALERSCRKNGAGAGNLPGDPGDRFRLVDRERRRQANVHAMREVEGAGRCDRAPDLPGRRFDVVPRRAQTRLRLADLELDQMVVAQRKLRQARFLLD